MRVPWSFILLSVVLSIATSVGILTASATLILHLNNAGEPERIIWEAHKYIRWPNGSVVHDPDCMLMDNGEQLRAMLPRGKR